MAVNLFEDCSFSNFVGNHNEIDLEKHLSFETYINVN